MSFRGPAIFKKNGGLGQTAPSDRNVGAFIVANGYATAESALGSIHELNSVDDLEALAFSAASDGNAAANTTAMTYMHTSEFFRLNPDGKLYLVNGNGVAPEDIFAANGPADQVMAAAQNGIRYMGLVFGVDPSDTITVANGFANFVATTRAAAQLWAEALAEAHVYVDVIVIEGYAASTTLVDLKTTDAPQVHITTACDVAYLEPLNEAALLKSGAVGTALGSIGVRMLSESMGSVTLERYPSTARGATNYSLVDTRRGRWLKPGLTDGRLFDDLSQAVRDDLTAKAYGYVGRYEGYSGVYFNGDATCTTVTDDFNTIHTNRIWNESARMVRRALIPKMNSRVRIDAETGRIAPATIADWDAAAKRQLDTLLAEGEIADYTFSLDPEQDVIAQGKVVTRLRIVPQGIAKAIEAEIGFSNPAQA